MMLKVDLNIILIYLVGLMKTVVRGFFLTISFVIGLSMMVNGFMNIPYSPQFFRIIHEHSYPCKCLALGMKSIKII